MRFFSPEMTDTKKNLNRPNVTHAWEFFTIVRYEYGTIHQREKVLQGSGVLIGGIS